MAEKVLQGVVEKVFAPRETSKGPAWDLKLDAGSREFKVTVWEQQDAEALRALEGSTVTITTNESKREKDGTVYTNYSLVKGAYEVGDIAPARASATVTEPTVPTTDYKATERKSIERQVAVKAAVEYAIATGLTRTEALSFAGQLADFIADRPEMAGAQEPELAGVAAGATESPSDGIEW